MDTIKSAGTVKYVRKKRGITFSPSSSLSFPVERVKAEAAEAASKQLAEMQKKNDQLLKEKEKRYQEHMKQLTEKEKQEQDQQTPEQQRAFEHKFMVFQLHHLLCSLHF